MGVWGLTEKELGISIERWNMKIRCKWFSEFGVKCDYNEKWPVVIRKWKWCPTTFRVFVLSCVHLNLVKNKALGSEYFKNQQTHIYVLIYVCNTVRDYNAI